jgi:hypothetical protein
LFWYSNKCLSYIISIMPNTVKEVSKKIAKHWCALCETYSCILYKCTSVTLPLREKHCISLVNEDKRQLISSHITYYHNSKWNSDKKITNTQDDNIEISHVDDLIVKVIDLLLNGIYQMFCSSHNEHWSSNPRPVKFHLDQ